VVGLVQEAQCDGGSVGPGVAKADGDGHVAPHALEQQRQRDAHAHAQLRAQPDGQPAALPRPHVQLHAPPSHLSSAQEAGELHLCQGHKEAARMRDDTGWSLVGSLNEDSGVNSSCPDCCAAVFANNFMSQHKCDVWIFDLLDVALHMVFCMNPHSKETTL
jgi:hypothetical protein